MSNKGSSAQTRDESRETAKEELLDRLGTGIDLVSALYNVDAARLDKIANGVTVATSLGGLAVNVFKADHICSRKSIKEIRLGTDK